MPTYVDPNACNACASEHLGPLCVYICPNDLMVLDIGMNKGANQEPDMCSECYACVKLCPTNAIHVRGYADYVPLGAEVQPHYANGDIVWDITFRNGHTEKFSFPVRTTLHGSTEPYKGFPEADLSLLKGPALAGEPGVLEIAEVPVPQK